MDPSAALLSSPTPSPSGRRGYGGGGGGLYVKVKAVGDSGRRTAVQLERNGCWHYCVDRWRAIG